MKCSYRELHFKRRKRQASSHIKRTPKIIGLDTEAFDSGEPFMICLSTGHTLNPKNILEDLFRLKLYQYTLVVWNIKYDEGAILYHIPAEYLQRLRTAGVVHYQDFEIRSIPNKCLSIKHNKHTIFIFDVAQFYAQSLDNAAHKYLNKSKISVETKTFKRNYVSQNWAAIEEYCINDAKLTAELAEFFLEILNTEFDIYPNKLYSVGYVAGLHFAKVCGIQDITRLRTFYPEVLEFFYNAYQGGKFETYQRGYGYFYEYDINSAYPDQITRLKSIEACKVVESVDYQPSADYGVMYCDILEYKDFSPVAIKGKSGLLNYYPVGMKRNRYITKRTYEYLIYHGAEVTIHKAYWLFCKDIYPFKTEIQRLFKLKADFKGNHELKYLITKLLLNSLYGKFIQVTPEYNEETESIDYYAGYLFNPIYASYITEGCRLKVCEVCNQFPDDIVAVHTDSIISTSELPLENSKSLGEWAFTAQGNGVMVGCGVYQIGEKTRYRGFVSDKGSSIKLLEEVNNSKGRKVLDIKQTLVLSWRNVIFRNELPDLINRFTKSSKQLNLEFDSRREWSSGWSWDNRLVTSSPRMVVI